MEARREIGLLLAAEGRCEQAGRYLAEHDDPDARLAHGRCLVALGRNDEAAERLPKEDDDLLVIEDASWLSGVLAGRGVDVPVPEPSDDAVAQAPPVTEPTGIWSRIEAEEEAAGSFRERLVERMDTSFK